MGDRTAGDVMNEPEGRGPMSYRGCAAAISVTGAALMLMSSAVSAAAIGDVFHPMLSPAPPGNTASTNIELQVLPFAHLEILGSNLLYLNVPPSGSTIPASGVSFVVIGNATATLTAEPDAFMELPVEGHMGRAVLNGESIGYKVEVRFPRYGAMGSPIQYAALPGFSAGPTEPPLSVDLTATGMQREGVIHMESDPNWTPHGGIPLPGVYVGQVTLTLTAD